MITEAEQDMLLRVRIRTCKAELAILEADLRALNRPRFINAAQVILEMDQRIAAQKASKITKHSKRDPFFGEDFHVLGVFIDE